ncbi:MAG: hypothetical protein EBR02_06905 [Alphaproteobacteria bacterium]|nr:hypothetical protein [Alphaproteobacteria bacterium]
METEYDHTFLEELSQYLAKRFSVSPASDGGKNYRIEGENVVFRVQSTQYGSTPAEADFINNVEARARGVVNFFIGRRLMPNSQVAVAELGKMEEMPGTGVYAHHDSYARDVSVNYRQLVASKAHVIDGVHSPYYPLTL